MMAKRLYSRSEDAGSAGTDFKRGANKRIRSGDEKPAIGENRFVGEEER